MVKLQFMRFIKRERLFVKRFPRLTRGVACLVLVIAIMACSVAITGATAALEVVIDGKTVGCVANTEEVDAAKKLASERVFDNDGKRQLEKVECVGVLTGSNKLQNPENIVEPLLNNADKLVKASIVTFGGKVIGFAASSEEMDDLIDKLLQAKKLEDNAQVASLCDGVEVIEAYFSSDLLATYDNLAQNQKALYSIPVKSGHSITVEEEIPYNTVTNKNSEYMMGTVITVRSGVKGKKSVTYNIYNVNGKETARQMTDQKVITAPVGKIVTVGTGTIAKGSVSNGLKNAYGFIWPVDNNVNNYVSAYFGDGRGHKGVDIAAKSGTRIFSAKEGTVEFAGYDGAYGLSIIVNVGGNMKLRYAHCSVLYVKNGDRVSTGENIALVGMTGQVTGPHLHFEVLIGGRNVNPAKFIGA
ncbi:MAG: peptidoglycan DD-metalloendopeptidase family protein [Oscillospiraceae bacterium]|nr:peptidoglycan DD-metalloendopeptidase family protein [Candidatus Equicaccousia limihippi]